MKSEHIAEAQRKPPIPEELLAACRLSPALYVERVLGVALHSFQPDFLDAVLRFDEVAVRSANGVGKSIVAALLANWFLDCRTIEDECKVLVTAPTHRQCENTYRYFRAFRLNAKYELPGTLMQQPFCRVSEMRFAHFFTAKDKEAFAGPHAKSMLIIVEEAGGVPEDIYEGVYGCAVGENDKIVHIGNPWSPSGTFASLWRRKPRSMMRTRQCDAPAVSTCDNGRGRTLRRCARHRDWIAPEASVWHRGVDGEATCDALVQVESATRLKLFTVSALDSPNVKSGKNLVPGLVSRKSVERIESRFGKSSDMYRVRVLGLPPRQNTSSVVPLVAWESAVARGGRFDAEEHPVVGRLRAGLDLGAGGDACAFVERDDVRVHAAETWSGERLESSRGRARKWLIEHPTGTLAVDASGLGLDTAELLADEFPGRIVAVQFGGGQVSEHPDHFIVASGRDDVTPLYANRRAEIWHAASRWLLEAGEISPTIADDIRAELEEDVLAPRWKTHARGQLLMEPKEETKKRIGRSPNLGDALALSCVADFEEQVVIAGAATSEPVRERWAPSRGREMAVAGSWRTYR